MTTEQRLERLERENRWMRRIGAVGAVVLLIGGGYAVYHFAMKGPVDVVETEETMQARRKAEAEAKRAVAEQRKAEKSARRNKAEARAGRHTNNELQVKLRNPISSVYDDVRNAAAREAEWKSLADEFEEWSKHDLAKEFEAESRPPDLPIA